MTSKHSTPLLALAVFCAVAAKPKPGDLMLQEAAAFRTEGRAMQMAGDLQEAKAAYQKAIAADPQFADAYNDLGVVLESEEDFQGAERAYRSSLSINPNFLAAHSNLASLYERQGRVKEAVDHWLIRLQMGEPKDPWVLKAREKLSQYQIAIPEPAEMLAKKRKLEAATAYEAGRDAIRKKRWDDAIAHFEHVLALDPTQTKAKRSLEEARSLKKRDEQDQARRLSRAQEEALSKAKRAIVPTPPPVQAKPEPPKKQMMEKVIKVKPAAPAPKPKTSAPVAVSREAMVAAQELAKEKAAARRETVRELLSKAVVAMRQAKYDEASSEFEQILLLEPGHPEAAEGLKRARAALGKSAKRTGRG